MYSEVIRLRPEEGLAYYRRANLLHEQGQLEAALADFFAVRAALLVGNGYATNLIAAQALRDLLSNPDLAQAMGQRARTFVAEQQGATVKTVDRIARAA